LKTFEECVKEVQEFCIEKGWYNEKVSVVQAGVLVCTEVAELYEAWRENGFSDSTTGDKPEGFGSELADIMIRLFDDLARFNWIIPSESVLPFSPYSSGILPHTGEAFNAVVAQMFTLGASLNSTNLYRITHLVRVLAALADIDLEFEYERKMVYNKTRPYRHGGKRA
jgi:NTP pyrophosphatase (non-canonical NTP hydrolase)